MKTNNIIMGVLVAVIAVMGVAFAAFSTQLTIHGTASIQSNWSIEFEAGNNGVCTAVSKDAAAPSSGTVSVTGTTATVTALMSSPGDSLECNIIAKNTGSLAAKRTSWVFTDTEAEGTLLDQCLGNLSASSSDVLEPLTGTETLTISISYMDTAGDDGSKPSLGKMEFTAVAVYEQALQ